MVRRALLLSLLALLVVPAGAHAQGRTFTTGVTLDTLAPGYDLDLWTRQVVLAKRTGVTTIRSEVAWADYEPQPGVVDPRFLATVDAATEVVRARGMKMVMVVQGTPCWATTAPESVSQGCDTREERQRAGSYPPKDPEGFADFAAAMAARYAPTWSAIEVWNEPDGEGEFYFGGPDKPQRYAGLMKALYPKVKAAAPGLTVLGGSLVGSNGRFLEELYEHGFKGTYDALSVHFYDLVLASLRAIRQVQVRNGDTKPLWLGEFGWSSCFPRKRTEQGGHACVTRAGQGRSIVDVLAAVRRARYLSGAVVYQLSDSTDLRFGLATNDLGPKPALRMVTAALERLPKPRRIALRLARRGGRVVARGSGPVGDVYEITVEQGRTLRYKAEFRLDRHGRFSLRLPSQLGTRGLTVRVKQYWLGGRGVSRRV